VDLKSSSDAPRGADTSGGDLQRDPEAAEWIRRDGQHIATSM
jgi:hypothetical protein